MDWNRQPHRIGSRGRIRSSTARPYEAYYDCNQTRCQSLPSFAAFGNPNLTVITEKKWKVRLTDAIKSPQAFVVLLTAFSQSDPRNRFVSEQFH